MLNILPPTRKKQQRLDRSYHFLLRTIIYTFIIIIVPAILFGGNYFFLKDTFNNIDEYNTPSLAQDNLEAMRENIQNFTEIMNKSESIQNAHTNPTILVYNFLEILPEETTIRNLEMSLTDKTVSFSGTTKDRDQLIKLQENLSNNELFINFTYPLGSLAEKEDINFEFQGEINLEAEALK